MNDNKTDENPIAPPRTLEELKAETQARAERQSFPLGGKRPDDVREALSQIESLDPDDWAAAFSRIGDRYYERARDAEAADPRAACRDFLQAWQYYWFARWPVCNSDGKRAAFARGVDAFARYARLHEPPLELVSVPYQGVEVKGYLGLPDSRRPVPLVLRISGLEGWRESAAHGGTAYLPHGIGFFGFGMPGAGDSPVACDVGAEGMFSAALDYLATRPEVDARRIVVQGSSWGGHWSARLGYVERDRLRGVVSQGGGAHYFFQPDWQRKALGTREFLFDLFPARASIYRTETLEDFLAYGPRLSLLDGGFVERPSAPMLLINGERDSQVPIDDLYLLLRHGSPKQAWINPKGGHGGRSPDWPESAIFEQVTLPWIKHRLGLVT